MVYLNLICFLIIYLILFLLEMKFWKSIATPFILTTAPIVFLLVFNQTVGVLMGFFNINNILFYIYFLFGFLSIFFASFFVRILASSQNFNFFKKNKFKNNVLQIKYASYLFKILLFIKISQILYFYITGTSFLNMKGLLGSGISGISTLLMIFCFVFFYGAYEKLKINNFVLMLLSILPLFLYGTRGWMFIAIIGAIMFKGYYHGKWPSKLFLLISPILGISFMMITYLFRNAVGEVDSNFYDIFQHVMGYFLAGIQGANQLLGSSVPTTPYLGMSFSALINLKEFLIGNKEYVSNIGPAFFNINKINVNLSNVNTAFGTLYHGLGPIFATIYIYMLYFILYFIFMVKYKIKNIFILMFYSVVMSGIFLSFFEYYLGLIFYFFATCFILCAYLLINYLISLRK